MPNEQLHQLTADLFKLLPLIRKKLMKPFEQIKPLSHMQLQILHFLESKDPLSMSELAAGMNMLKQQLTFLTNKLEELNFIERVHDKIDRRSVKISITPCGIAALKEHREQSFKLIAGKLSELSDEDIDELHGAIQSLSKIINRL